MKVIQRNIELNSGNIFIRRKYLDILLETDQGLIGIEINSSVEDYLHPRNLAFQCDKLCSLHFSGAKLYGRCSNYSNQSNLWNER